MAEMVLHQWAISPFCGKVRKILHYKGLSFRVVNYHGLLGMKASKLTPAGKLPVLDYDGERIQDSMAISAFLEDRFPEPSLLPADPRERAQARIFENWAGESLYWFEIYYRFFEPAALKKTIPLLCDGRPAYEQVAMRLAARQIKNQAKKQGIARRSPTEIERDMVGFLDDLDTLLRDCEWLVGDAMSIADVSVSAQLDEVMRTSRMSEAIKAREALHAWLKRCDLESSD